MNSPISVPATSSCKQILLSLDAMATRFELVLYGDDKSHLRAAGEEALEEIAVLDRQLSRFRPDSDISWINVHAFNKPVKVEPRLFRLLEYTQELHRMTLGAFDITIGPLMRAWGFVNGSGSVPDVSALNAARSKVGMEYVELNPEDFTIRFHRDGMELDLGAIGKGCAIEQAANLLKANNITNALIHGGTSTICAIGAPPDADAWNVGIRHPSSEKLLEVVELHDSSLSVSAVHGKSFSDGTTEYGHIIDPRTGKPATSTILAAIWGPSPTDTDALSTAALVMGETEMKILIEVLPNCHKFVFARGC